MPDSKTQQCIQACLDCHAMPMLPVIGTGLSPLAQGIVIPIAAFWWARRPFFD
jgi:hypothetical protein